MTFNIDKIRNLAAFVRQDIIELVKGNFDIDPDDLCGACAIASYALHKMLLAQGYDKVSFVVRYSSGFGGHCWVELNGMVIDITATQFKGPEVAIYPTGTEPKWLPVELSLDQYDDNELDVVELRDAEGLEYIECWGQQNPLIYEEKIESLVDKYRVFAA